MSARLRNIDRRTPLLLPVDLREWVADDDLAHFILEALETLDMSQAALNSRGTGSQQYPPSMLLAVLIYCYANGIFSSRKIEQATYRHVSVRYLSGDTHPDHDTICTFRRANKALLERAFLHVLLLAREIGLLQVGTVSLDGTKIHAAASKRRTLKMQEIEEALAELEAEVQSRLKQAEQANSATADPDDRLPPSLRDRQARRQQLEQARQRLQDQQKTLATQRQIEREQARQQGRKLLPPLPKEPGADASINLSDPESRLLPSSKEGWVQGYNAQLAVAQKSRLIVAAEVCTQTSDQRQLEPMAQKIPMELIEPTHLLVDSGYDNQAQIEAVEQNRGITVLCPPCASPPRTRRWPLSRSEQRVRQGRQRMHQRLDNPEGKKLYALRQITVEPVIGVIKSVLGFRRFLLRGLEKVKTEWLLICLAYNCKKMARV